MNDINNIKKESHTPSKNNLKENFLKKNFSLFSNNKDMDSLGYTDLSTQKIITYKERMEFINRVLFNFLTFAAVTLSIFLAIIILSISANAVETKNKITDLSYSGFKSLEEAKNSLIRFDFLGTENNFRKAYQALNRADEEISRKKILTASISMVPIASDYQKTAKSLVAMGKDVSLAGIGFTENIKEFSSLGKDPVNSFSNIRKNQELIKEKIKSSEIELLKIDTQYLDKENAEKIEEIKNALPELNYYLNLTDGFINKLSEIMGFNGEKNYLIVFQNNNEMRSTGGFIGSFGILKVKDGKIEESFVDDIYKLDKYYSEAVIAGKENYIPPPFPMDPKYTGNWAMRDSNINPDFSKASQSILDFYKKEIKYAKEKKYPEKLDGIISITPTVFEDILKILGPITLEDYNLTVSSNNLLETLQLEVESGKDKQGNKNPKTVLEVLKNKLLERLNNVKGDEAKNIGFSVLSRLSEKHILLYSLSPEVESLFSKLNWSGETLSPDSDDFLMIINNNFGGGKSSLKIAESIKYDVNISEDGSVNSLVKITREHTSDYHLKYLDPWSGNEMWLIGDNNNYTKIYTPRGAQLIKAQGFENKIDIYDENGKTAFGSMLSVKPKQKKEAFLNYTLPFKINSSGQNEYNIFFQKQSGSLGSNIEAIIKIPSGFKIDETNGKIENDNTVSFKDTLNIDQTFNIKFSPKK